MPRGESAYFSPPEPDLDPALFTGPVLRPEVREYILRYLTDFFRFEGIQPGTWLHAWLAGSGVSYQWKASRGNGDLDVLLGIEVTGFLQRNPDFAVGSREQLAATLNEQMKKYLWPLTSAAIFGAKTYEVTYYWNPEAAGDIRAIHPYAAWSLDRSQWDVPPDPHPPLGSLPLDWLAMAAEDAAYVHDLYHEWSQHLHDVTLIPSQNPSSINAKAALRRVTGELRRIWDTLHNGRRSAFTAGGSGWADIHNFRWQAAKANGTLSRLREVISTDDSRQAESDTRLYGAPVGSAELLLRRAASMYSGGWKTP